MGPIRFLVQITSFDYKIASNNSRALVIGSNTVRSASESLLIADLGMCKRFMLHLGALVLYM